MNFVVSANTDVGTVKNTNQDSLSVKVINTPQGRMVLAVLCDGMGGLDKGEVASASVIKAFGEWVVKSMPYFTQRRFSESDLREQWYNIVKQQNVSIRDYGAKLGIKLGTTLVAMLITQTKYYIMNVGDSRAYEISDNVYVLTKDQTLVAREVELGNLSPADAERDPRRSVLLQCVGASDAVYPDMFTGDVKENATYMLCSDGFRHLITPHEMYEKFRADVLFDDQTMSRHTMDLIELNKSRGERDNISALLVRTF